MVIVLCEQKGSTVYVAGNFLERKLSRIGEKYDFRGENLRGLLAFAAPRQISRRKLS